MSGADSAVMGGTLLRPAVDKFFGPDRKTVPAVGIAYFQYLTGD
jgi:hypothetical protein